MSAGTDRSRPVSHPRSSNRTCRAVPLQPPKPFARLPQGNANSDVSRHCRRQRTVLREGRYKGKLLDNRQRFTSVRLGRGVYGPECVKMRTHYIPVRISRLEHLLNLRNLAGPNREASERVGLTARRASQRRIEFCVSSSVPFGPDHRRYLSTAPQPQRFRHLSL